MAGSSTALREEGGGKAADATLFRDIARYAPTMLWVSDADGAMTFLNQQYLNFTGLTAAQARSPTSWKEHVHPDGRVPPATPRWLLPRRARPGPATP
jgi:PAS domain-containing protein